MKVTKQSIFEAPYYRKTGFGFVIQEKRPRAASRVADTVDMLVFTLR